MTKIGMAAALVSASLVWPLSVSPQVQRPAAPYEVGTVYYANQGSFKPLAKETAPQSGRSNYAARVKGAHAEVRLLANQPQMFLVCGVDPSRFKLFAFKSDKNSRTVTISKVNMWIGGSKTVLSESEIPVSIQQDENGCFKLTPKQALGNGEFGFSPVESMDAFMFGIGDVKRPD